MLLLQEGPPPQAYEEGQQNLEFQFIVASEKEGATATPQNHNTRILYSRPTLAHFGEGGTSVFIVSDTAPPFSDTRGAATNSIKRGRRGRGISVNEIPIQEVPARNPSSFSFFLAYENPLARQHAHKKILIGKRWPSLVSLAICTSDYLGVPSIRLATWQNSSQMKQQIGFSCQRSASPLFI